MVEFYHMDLKKYKCLMYESLNQNFFYASPYRVDLSNGDYEPYDSPVLPKWIIFSSFPPHSEHKKHLGLQHRTSNDNFVS